MSTRCIIHFYDEDYVHANPDDSASVYRHFDGYPEHESGIACTLSGFFSEVIEQTGAVGHDAAQLSAQYVVWQSTQYRRDPNKPLDFQSIYIMKSEPSDIQYRYRVYCGYDPTAIMQEQPSFPRVTVEERNLYTDTWSHAEWLVIPQRETA